MSKDDRNVAIIVAIVLVVCTVSLVLILNVAWQLIKPNVETLLTLFGVRNQPMIAINYNFTVPVITPEDIAGSIDYDFSVPGPIGKNYDEGLVGKIDSVGSDAQQLLTHDNTAEQIVYNIRIPKLSIDSKVIVSGQPGAALSKGFWKSPGALTLLCQRTYFPPSDPRSCWFLGELEIGDEIILSNLAEETRFKVNFIDVYQKDDPSAYIGNGNELRIVSSNPVGTDTGRLVISASV